MMHRLATPRAAVISLLIGCVLIGAVITDGIVDADGQPPRGGANAGTVLVVAHEGARNPTFTRRALSWKANVLEMDTVAFRGQLYVSHQPVTAASARSTPLVSQVWPIACQAPIVEFDVKDTSQTFDGLLVMFLRTHHGSGTPQVFVSSRNLQSLSMVHAGAPWVFRFLSIGDEDHLVTLRQNPAIAAALDGVSIRQSLLDAPTVAWLHRHRLLVFAWTVDSTPRTEELIRDGVDGITTDEPAIIGMIVHQERGKPHLLRDRTA